MALSQNGRILQRNRSSWKAFIFANHTLGSQTAAQTLVCWKFQSNCNNIGYSNFDCCLKMPRKLSGDSIVDYEYTCMYNCIAYIITLPLCRRRSNSAGRLDPVQELRQRTRCPVSSVIKIHHSHAPYIWHRIGSSCNISHLLVPRHCIRCTEKTKPKDMKMITGAGNI